MNLRGSLDQSVVVLLRVSGVTIAAVSIGCGAATAARSSGRRAAATEGQNDAQLVVGPPRWVALPEPPDAVDHGTDSSGGRRYLVHGLRVVVHPDGTTDQADEQIPANGSTQSVRLPEHLGGGFVFYVTSDETPIWRASSWTGPLEPLAQLPIRADWIVAGFDRVYVAEQRTREVVALDPATRRLVDLHPLPPAPAYGSMAFVDAWFGAVEVPYRGVLVTFDAGDSWHPTGFSAVRGLGVEGRRLVLEGAGQEGQDLVIEQNGRLYPHRPAAAAATETSISPPLAGNARREVPGTVPDPIPRLHDALRKAVLYGWPDSRLTAVLADGGALARVRLRDGKLLDRAPHAFGRDGGTCTTMPVGGGFGFVCTRGSRGTSIYRFSPPFGVEPVVRFAEPRSVLSSGNGSFLVRGRCSGAPGRGTREVWCAWHQGMTAREIPAPPDARAVVLRDGRAALLRPPTPKHPGTLTLLSPAGAEKKLELKLPNKLDRVARKILTQGLWLDGVIETEEDRLAAWVVEAESFLGVRLDLDGRIEIGELRHGLPRTLLSGLLALTVEETGTVSESVDGGMDWSTSELPVVDVLPDANERRTRTEQGCSRVGCAVGTWVRVGWNSPATGPVDLKVAKSPEPVRLPAAAGGRWLYECVPTGRKSPERTPSAQKVDDDDAVQGESGRPWATFYGRAMPALGPESIGWSRAVSADDAEISILAWGPKGPAWEQRSRWQVLVAPANAVERPVWATVIARSPWSTESAAREAFGKNSATELSWSVELEPSGRSGILRGASSSGAHLYLLEDGRSIATVLDSPSQVSGLSGVVKVDDRLYFGTKSGSEHFRVYEVTGNRAVLFAEYGEVSRRLEPKLVRDDAARSLAVWARDEKMRGAATTWYVYPIDRRTGSAHEPLVLHPHQLGARPPPCSTDASGWVLEGEPPLQPLLELKGASEDDENPRGVRARLLAGVSRLCLAGMTGRIDGAGRVRKLPPARQALLDTSPSSILVVNDRNERGQKWEFRCLD